VVLDITIPLSYSNILDAFPDLSKTQATPGAKAAKSPVRITADRQQSAHLDGAAGTKKYDPCYLIRVRRRWIKTIRMMTANTPATI
jgi:hypothetical protein